jgi:hypothetical protein
MSRTTTKNCPIEGSQETEEMPRFRTMLKALLFSQPAQSKLKTCSEIPFGQASLSKTYYEFAGNLHDDFLIDVIGQSKQSLNIRNGPFGGSKKS